MSHQGPFETIRSHVQKQATAGESFSNSKELIAFWKEKAGFARYLWFEHTRFLAALCSENESSFGDRLQALKTRNETPKSKKTKQRGDPLYDEKLLCQLMDVYLSVDYDPPQDPKRLQDHLMGVWIFYVAVLPYLDKIYPQINMKLDFVLAKLAYQAGISIADSYCLGKQKDALRPAVEAKKTKAKKITQKIDALIQKIAVEPDKKKRANLINEARSLADLSDTRAIINRVKAYKNKQRKDVASQ
jgi:hypothetical protein